MIDPKIENFLEKADMNYLFCLLSKLEAGRLSQLPVYVRNNLEDKFAVLAMRHVAENDVPDYITEHAESELAEQQTMSENDMEDMDLAEETYDDSLAFTGEPSQEDIKNPFGPDEDDEDYFDEDDEFYDSEDDDDEEDE